MKEVFSKTDFPSSHDGDIYHWKDADILFQIPNEGNYIIAITASAKNAKQNKSTDDDDLRISIDDYRFGKYEEHDEKISWKGFGTSASWDGASLKGGIKTNYFFIKLQKGEHKIKFYADKTPTLKEIKIFQFKEGEKFEIKEQKPCKDIKTDKNGIPWMSFVFLGVKPAKFLINSTCKSAKQKLGTDGDNIKVIVNGKILQSPSAPTSKKYKNYYFSGDLNKGKSDTLKLESKEFEFIEDSVELWYDETPAVSVDIEVFDIVKWIEMGVPINSKYRLYEKLLDLVIFYFSRKRYEYAKKLLQHSLSDNPEKLIYNSDSPLAERIKKDKAYNKILSIVKNEIEKGILNGQIYTGDEEKGLSVEFENSDLKYSLHGLKKIEYIASKKSDNEYNLELNLFDVYDFDPKDYEISLTWPFVYIAGALENINELKNFEIEINILDSIKIVNE